MTEELLEKIREESKEETSTLDEFNAYAELRSKLEKIENIKGELGLLYTINMGLGPAKKTESDVIMGTYEKYLSQIEEEDTNNIYVYIGTYMFSEFSYAEIENGRPFEIEVDMNDSRATHRYYWNLEGVWSKSVDIEDCVEFERTHTVIYADNFCDVEKEFIVTAVKESQERAVSKVIKKYKSK